MIEYEKREKRSTPGRLQYTVLHCTLLDDVKEKSKIED